MSTASDALRSEECLRRHHRDEEPSVGTGWDLQPTLECNLAFVGRSAALLGALWNSRASGIRPGIAWSRFSIARDLPYSMSMGDGNAQSREWRVVLAENACATLSANGDMPFSEKAAPHIVGVSFA